MASQPVDEIDLEEERRWVERAQRGDLDAFRPIFDRYAGALYATVIMPKLGNASAAEDVLRDTMMTAIEKIASFEWQGKTIYVWLRQIAANKAYDVHRRGKRQQRLADKLAFESDPLTDDPPDALLIAEQDRSHNRERIAEVLGKLPDRYRQAIELRLIQDCTREHCAEALAITVGNFDVVFHRAVRAFRKLFTELGEIDAQ